LSHEYQNPSLALLHLQLPCLLAGLQRHISVTRRLWQNFGYSEVNPESVGSGQETFSEIDDLVNCSFPKIQVEFTRWL
jgi:hypothetical protein